MARQTRSESGPRRRRPAMTPDEREAELSSMAHDLAEEQILNGTVSSQVLTHFIKAGSRREEIERLKIEHEIELMEVKKESLKKQDRLDELFADAINAMRGYQGQGPEPMHED